MDIVEKKIYFNSGGWAAELLSQSDRPLPSPSEQVFTCLDGNAPHESFMDRVERAHLDGGRGKLLSLLLELLQLRHCGVRGDGAVLESGGDLLRPNLYLALTFPYQVASLRNILAGFVDGADDVFQNHRSSNSVCHLCDLGERNSHDVTSYFFLAMGGKELYVVPLFSTKILYKYQNQLYGNRWGRV